MNPDLTFKIATFIQDNPGCPFSEVNKIYGTNPEFKSTWTGMSTGGGNPDLGYIVRVDNTGKCYPGPQFDLAKMPRVSTVDEKGNIV